MVVRPGGQPALVVGKSASINPYGQEAGVVWLSMASEKSDRVCRRTLRHHKWDRIYLANIRSEHYAANASRESLHSDMRQYAQPLGVNISKQNLPAFERHAERIGKVVNKAERGISRFVELPANIAAHRGSKLSGIVRVICWICLFFPPLWILWLLMLAWSSSFDQKS